MDIRTPEMNGKETYKQLQKKHPPLASSAIFTTGDVLSEDTAFLEADRPAVSTQTFLP